MEKWQNGKSGKTRNGEIEKWVNGNYFTILLFNHFT
jgi:hypothetical protein